MSTKIPSNIVQWLAIHTFNEKGPINLDDMDENDLRQFVEFDDNDEGARTLLANHCFPQGADVTGHRAAEVLFRYARCRLKAIWARLDGRIGEALTYERYCDEWYGELPEFAQW